MTEPLVTLCRQLCYPCVTEAHAGLMRWERKELQTTFPQIPSAWSTWLQLCAAQCHQRRAGLGLDRETGHDHC